LPLLLHGEFPFVLPSFEKKPLLNETNFGMKNFIKTETVPKKQTKKPRKMKMINWKSCIRFGEKIQIPEFLEKNGIHVKEFRAQFSYCIQLSLSSM